MGALGHVATSALLLTTAIAINFLLCPASAVGDRAEVDECTFDCDTSIETEDIDDIELMRVSMLQSSIKIVTKAKMQLEPQPDVVGPAEHPSLEEIGEAGGNRSASAPKNISLSTLPRKLEVHRVDSGQTYLGSNVSADIHKHGVEASLVDVSTSVGYPYPALHLPEGILLWMLYCGFCVYSEYTKESDTLLGVPMERKPRIAEWDLLKFVIMLFVIWGHARYLAETPDELKGDTLPFISGNWDRWFNIVKMPAFCFMSGVWGGGVSKDSITSMLCYTLGTSLLMCLLTDTSRLLVNAAYHGFSDPLPGLAVEEWGRVPTDKYSPNVKYWYLFSLCAWRLTISPVFHHMSVKMAFARFAPFTVVAIALFFGHYAFSRTSIFLVNSMFMPNTWYLGLFFAMGLLKQPKEWGLLFSHKRLQLLASLALVIFYINIIAFPVVRSWLPWVCVTQDGLTHDYKNCADHYPRRVMAPGLGLHQLLFDSGVFISHAIFTLAALCSIWGALSSFMAAFPRAAALMEGCGSRTLYAYVLSQFLIQEIVLASLNPVFLSLPASYRGAAVFLFSVQLNLALSCRGAERLFSWAVMPFWIRDTAYYVLYKLRPDDGSGGLVSKCSDHGGG